jgi:alcohol dehydrogenase (cytochrome c)
VRPPFRRLWVFNDNPTLLEFPPAVAFGRLFLPTWDGRFLALDAATGRVLWRHRTDRCGWGSPTVWRGLVITTYIGHDCNSKIPGTDGEVVAYAARSGAVRWRFRLGPCESSPLVVDGLVYIGDWHAHVYALDAATGRLRWYYQYTPHDVWDWDAQQPPVLVDIDWKGQRRRVLLHANRNGFFYVLDRTNGELLRATRFVKTLTWAREIGPDGRPVLNPGQEPTREGTRVCPAVEGATNWFSTAFHPGTGLYYVQTLEKCSIFVKTPQEWQAGRSYFGGSTRQVPEEVPQKVLRAIDGGSGAIRWELPQIGPATSWGGVLATAGGLVFFGEDSGALVAADASTGAPLWQFQTSQLWKASPMTYAFDGTQYVAVASGPNVIAFALMEPTAAAPKSPSSGERR